jgi:hypothetical protein
VAKRDFAPRPGRLAINLSKNKETSSREFKANLAPCSRWAAYHDGLRRQAPVQCAMSEPKLDNGAASSFHWQFRSLGPGAWYCGTVYPWRTLQGDHFQTWRGSRLVERWVCVITVLSGESFTSPYLPPLSPAAHGGETILKSYIDGTTTILVQRIHRCGGNSTRLACFRVPKRMGTRIVSRHILTAENCFINVSW